jgi:uncharacterized protein YlxW (UPF0749 family)
MKKNIAIIILVLTNLLSLVYAFAQATIAQRSEEEALRQREFAEAQTLIAQINADSARVTQERAQLYKKLAEKTMEDLQMAKLEIEKCK